MASLDNGYLVSASDDKSIKVWDVTNKIFKYKIDSSNGGHIYYIHKILSLPNGHLASGSEDGTVKIWDLND